MWGFCVRLVHTKSKQKQADFCSVSSGVRWRAARSRWHCNGELRTCCRTDAAAWAAVAVASTWAFSVVCTSPTVVWCRCSWSLKSVFRLCMQQMRACAWDLCMLWFLHSKTCWCPAAVHRQCGRPFLLPFQSLEWQGRLRLLCPLPPLSAPVYGFLH